MTTHYVAQTAAGDEDGSTYADRMDVVDHNADTYGFAASDVIYLCDTISSQVIIPVSGSTGVGNRIEYNGNLSGHEGVLTANSSGGALRGLDLDYITVDNIEVQNGNIGITLLNNCNYITIKKCLLHDMTGKGILFGSDADPKERNSNIIIGGNNGDGNEVYNIGRDTGSVDLAISNSDYIEVSYNKSYATITTLGIEGINCLSCTNGLIEYNTVYDHKKAWSSEYNDMGEDGIDVKGSDTFVVRYNHVHGNRVAGIALVDQYGINSNNVEIYNNYVYNHRTGISLESTDENVYVYNNVINKTTGGHGISAPVGDNIQIYNNTIINCHGVDHTKFAIVLGYGTNYIAKNNILYSDSHSDLISVSVPAQAILDNNQYYYTGGAAKVYWDGANRTIPVLQSTYSQEANGQEGDPKLTNVASDILTLLSTSPCINQGADLGSSYDDALDPDNTDFTTFPPTVETLLQGDHGTAWEMGAYVYIDQSHTPYTRFRGIKSSKNYNLIGRFR